MYFKYSMEDSHECMELRIAFMEHESAVVEDKFDCMEVGLDFMEHVLATNSYTYFHMEWDPSSKGTDQSHMASGQ